MGLGDVVDVVSLSGILAMIGLLCRVPLVVVPITSGGGKRKGFESFASGTDVVPSRSRS